MTTVIPVGLATMWGVPLDSFEVCEEGEEADKPTESQVGLSYVCKPCDVYGYIAAGEPRLCWNCGKPDLVKR